MNKLYKFIALLLALLVTLTMVAGCKSADNEDFTASNENWVDVTDPDEEKKETDKETEKEDKEAEGDDPKEEDPKEEDPKENSKEDPKENSKEDPKEENPKEEDPKEEEPKEEDPKEEDQPAVKKESSGTLIKFLSQNVKHGGNTYYGEKGDGTDINIYNRLRRFKSLVMTQDPDVIFYNECRNTMFRFYEEDEYFSKTYTMLYEYRWEDRPDLGGLMSEPVLFKTAKYELLDSGHFWISETPNQPGAGFGNQVMADISMWVKLKDKETGSVFYCFNAHFDPGNEECYIPAMQLYYDRFAKMKDSDYAFVGGDYNYGYRTANYQLAVDWNEIVDLRDVAMNMNADGLCELGGMASGHNLAMEAQPAPLPQVNTKNPQIDQIMMKPNPRVAVDRYGFDYNIYGYEEEGIAKGHISDHFGLVAYVRIDTDVDYSQYHVEHEYEGSMWFNEDVLMTF